MGVDRTAVSGYGILVDDVVISKIISRGFLTEEEWRACPDEKFEACGLIYAQAGEYSWTGRLEDRRYYFVCPGDNLEDLIGIASAFIVKLSMVGVGGLEFKDLIKISDIHVW